MSDIFGIGTAVRSMLCVYTLTARQSGRTLALVESLKDGDRVWFTNDREATRVKRMCAERGVTIEARVCSDPKNVSKIYEGPTAQGKVRFDHSWVEKYYEDVLRDAGEWITRVQEATGHADGQGEAHIQTRIAAREHERFMSFLPKD